MWIKFKLRKIPKDKTVYFWTRHNLIYSLMGEWDITYKLCDILTDKQVISLAKSFDKEFYIYPYGDSLFYTTKTETK